MIFAPMVFAEMLPTIDPVVPPISIVVTEELDPSPKLHLGGPDVTTLAFITVGLFLLISVAD